MPRVLASFTIATTLALVGCGGNSGHQGADMSASQDMGQHGGQVSGDMSGSVSTDMAHAKPDMAHGSPDDLATTPPDMLVGTGCPDIVPVAAGMGGEIALAHPSQDIIGAFCSGWVLVGDRVDHALVLRNVYAGATGASVSVGVPPGRMAWDASNGIAYALLDANNGAARVDTSDFTATTIAGVAGDDLVLGHGAQLLTITVTNISNPTLHIFDASGATAATTLTLSEPSFGDLLAYDRTHDLLYIGARAESPSGLARYVFDPMAQTATLSQSVTGNGGSDAGALEFSNGNTLALSPDGTRLMFSSVDAHYTIEETHSDELNVSDGEFAVGPYPAAAAVSPDGKYFASTDGTNLEVFSMQTRVKAASVKRQVANCSYSSNTKYRVAFSAGSKLAYMLTSTCASDDSGPSYVTWVALP